MKKITLALIILISIIVFCGITNAINDGIDLAKVNAMYEDIETLEDKIALYYLDYGYIPVKEKEILIIPSIQMTMLFTMKLI